MKALKIIYYLSLMSLVFWLVARLLFAITPLEMTGHFEEQYIRLRFFSVPIAILLTLSGTLNKEDSDFYILLKIISTVVIACISSVMMVIVLFANMCSYSAGTILYQNKIDSSEKIVMRDYGCGATDSSPVSVSISRIKYYTKGILIVRQNSVDTNKIYHLQWERIEQPE